MTSRRTFWITVILTCLGFALRCVDMTGRSLWTDESFTLLRIQGSWAEMFTNTVVRQNLITTDLNPPFYFALLKLWAGAAGDSDFALRLFSVFWSVLALPLSVALARRLHSNAAGVLTGLFLLTCPATQWYGWEVRNYAIVEALAALNGYLVLRWLHGTARERGPRIAIVTGWLISALAGVYTHYTFAGFAAGQLVAVLPTVWRWLRRMPRPQVLRVAGAIGLLAAALWVSGLSESLAYAIDLHVMPSLRQPRGSLINPAQLLLDVAGAMQFGLSAADPTGSLLNILFLALSLSGLIVLRRRAAALAGAVLGSVLMWWALAFVISNTPSFRYLMPLVPVLYASAAGLVLTLSKRLTVRSHAAATVAGLAAVALVLGPHAHGLSQTFTRKATSEDDWRALSGYLRDNWQPGDVLLINLITPESVLRKYLAGLPIDMLAFGELNQKYDAGLLAPDALQQRYRRMWVANTGGDFSTADVARWLPATPATYSRRFPGRTTVVQLDLHTLTPQVSADPPEGVRRIEGADVEDAPSAIPVRLTGWRIAAGNPYHNSTNFQLQLSWRRVSGEGSWTAPVQLRLRLRSGERVWHTLELPAELQQAPDAWGRQGAATFTSGYVIPIPPGLPPLAYVMDLDVLAGEKAELAQSVTVDVDAADRDCCIVLPGPAGADFWTSNGIALARAEYPEHVRIGQPLPIVLSWRRLTADAQSWRTRLALAPLVGAEIASAEADTGAGDVPLAAWRLGAWVRDGHTVQLPYAARPGPYRLTLTRLVDGQARDNTTLGIVWVDDYPASPVPADPTVPLQATVGEFTLMGLRLPQLQRGATSDIHTLWRVDRAPQRDGVLFLHIVNPDGTPGPQDDNPPERGARATLTYRAGDGIDQIHRVIIPADAPPGEYRIYVGVYNRGDKERWEASQNAAPARDNLILAATFTLD